MGFSLNLGLEVDLEFQPTRKYTVIISQIQGKQLHFTFDRETWNFHFFCLWRSQKFIKNFRNEAKSTIWLVQSWVTIGNTKSGSTSTDFIPQITVDPKQWLSRFVRTFFGRHFFRKFVLGSLFWTHVPENPIKPHLGRPYSLVGTPAASTISEPNRLLPQRNIQRRQTKKG